MTPNKVPKPRSKAGPGCWQCADCGLINGDDRDECWRCSGDWGGNDGDDTDATALGDFDE